MLCLIDNVKTYFNRRNFEAPIKITPVAPKNIGKLLSLIKFPNNKTAETMTNNIPV